MSEQNKNRNKDKNNQNNKNKKHNRQADFVEFASEPEFLNLDGKRNKRDRGNDD